MQKSSVVYVRAGIRMYIGIYVFPYICPYHLSLHNPSAGSLGDYRRPATGGGMTSAMQVVSRLYVWMHLRSICI